MINWVAGGPASEESRLSNFVIICCRPDDLAGRAVGSDLVKETRQASPLTRRIASRASERDRPLVEGLNGPLDVILADGVGTCDVSSVAELGRVRTARGQVRVVLLLSPAVLHSQSRDAAPRSAAQSPWPGLPGCRGNNGPQHV